MFLSRWFQRAERRGSRRARPARPSFRPNVESLDSRDVPSAAPAAATHFLVITPRTATADVVSPFEVVALDASNHVVRNYAGTVHLTSSDNGASLPADYTFTARDRGVHVFTETPSAGGTETLTATDTADASITGSASLTVNPAPVATHFAVVVESPAYVGSPARVAVVALDASNHRVPNYTGTVHLTSSDTAAKLPADYTFTAADHGLHVLSVTFGTAGSQTVTATDTKDSSITATATATVNPAQVATHFSVLTLPRAFAGAPTYELVVALDSSNHVVRNYTGTVHLTSSDTAASLPGDYTFTTADRGVHVFQVTLTTTGSQTLTATDTSDATIIGTATVNVRSAPPWLFSWF
jgi:cytochrome c oxidase assembly protein Cox11